MSEEGGWIELTAVSVEQEDMARRHKAVARAH